MYMHMFSHMCETADAQNPVMARSVAKQWTQDHKQVSLDHQLGTFLTACNDIQRGVEAAAAEGPRGAAAMLSTAAEAGWGPEG